jgi:hypothetical protein
MMHSVKPPTFAKQQSEMTNDNGSDKGSDKGSDQGSDRGSQKSFAAEDFMDEMENQQEVVYEEDDEIDPDELRDQVAAIPTKATKDVGKPIETFPNKALLRQVNYVQETPINIDYSRFDKLALIQ